MCIPMTIKSLNINIIFDIIGLATLSFSTIIKNIEVTGILRLHIREVNVFFGYMYK